MSNYNIQIPGERNWEEKRDNSLKGELSQPSDVEEAFREVCSLNKRKLTDMRALAKVNKPPMSIGGLSTVCIDLGLMLVIDGSMDFFCVKHQDKGELPVLAPTAVEEDNILDTVEVDDDEDPLDDRFQEIDSDEPISDEVKIDEDEEEELF